MITFAKTINALIHPSSRLSGLINKIMNRDRIYDAIMRFDLKIGSKKNRVLKKSKYYGCYILARKGEAINFKNLNIKEFAH